MARGAGAAVSAECLLIEEISTHHSLCGRWHSERGAHVILRGCRSEREVRVRLRRVVGKIKAGGAYDRKRRRGTSRGRGDEALGAIDLGISGEASVRDAEISREDITPLGRISLETHFPRNWRDDRRDGEVRSRSPGKVREALRCDQDVTAAHWVAGELETVGLVALGVEEDQHCIGAGPTVWSPNVLPAGGLHFEELNARVAACAPQELRDPRSDVIVLRLSVPSRLRLQTHHVDGKKS